MADSAAMISAIETNLATLYTKLHKTLSQKDRTAVLQDIETLETSLEFWERRAARADGSRPRVADINLEGF